MDIVFKSTTELAKFMSHTEEDIPLYTAQSNTTNMHLSYLSLYDVNCPFSQNGPDFKLCQKAGYNRKRPWGNSDFFAYYLKKLKNGHFYVKFVYKTVIVMADLVIEIRQT